MLEVQKFLLNNSPEKLVEDFAIKINDYPEDGIMMLNYNMIDSPKTHPITMECRSLILSRNTYEVISRKFDRFFNLGENPEFYTDFDFENCYIMEKVDGSLTSVYWNPNTTKFEISTRSQAKAELIHEVGGSWRNMILNAFGFNSEEEFQNYFANISDSKTITFIFEFVSPLNRIVTPYTEAEMVLIGGTINNCGYSTDWLTKDQLDFYANIFSDKNVRLPLFYTLTNHVNIRDVANNLSGLKEGFVLWDEKINKRVKVKSTAYLTAHRIRGENSKPTPKNILTLIFTGENDEFLVYFPEYKDLFAQQDIEISRLNSALTDYWKFVKDVEDQKTFANLVKNSPYSSIFFMAKKQNIHPLQLFHNLPVEKKLKYFNV